MAAKSTPLANEILNYWLRNQAHAIPQAATVYAGLFTAAPAAGPPTTAGTEVSGGSYARTATSFGVPSNGTSLNSAPVAFPTATLNWGTVVAVGIFDQASGGNLLYFGTLTTPKAVDNGDTASFAVSALSITEQLQGSHPAEAGWPAPNLFPIAQYAETRFPWP